MQQRSENYKNRKRSKYNISFFKSVIFTERVLCLFLFLSFFLPIYVPMFPLGTMVFKRSIGLGHLSFSKFHFSRPSLRVSTCLNLQFLRSLRE
jgi:hypothetical protein